MFRDTVVVVKLSIVFVTTLCMNKKAYSNIDCVPLTTVLPVTEGGGGRCHNRKFFTVRPKFAPPPPHTLEHYPHYTHTHTYPASYAYKAIILNNDPMHRQVWSNFFTRTIITEFYTHTYVPSFWIRSQDHPIANYNTYLHARSQVGWEL